MANPFVHVELRTDNPEKAKAFYGKLFGWKLEDVPIQTSSDGPKAGSSGPNTYTTIDVGEDGTGGGIMRNPDEGQPSWWLAYVAVDNVAEATKKAQSLGGKIEKDVTEVPGMGSFSVVSDPTGAKLGLWTPAKR